MNYSRAFRALQLLTKIRLECPELWKQIVEFATSPSQKNRRSA